MKIKEITFEMGNDFAAVMVCEHCEATQKISSGYHDNYYHTVVIPGMVCQSCGKTRLDERVELVLWPGPPAPGI